MTPTPYDSGQSQREQGISKAGNKHVRGLIVELAWRWLRWQPDSALSQWYQRRFGSRNKRVRKIGIVALARKRLIALWRYVQQGELPAGAQEKDWRLRVDSTARRHAKAAAAVCEPRGAQGAKRQGKGTKEETAAAVGKPERSERAAAVPPGEPVKAPFVRWVGSC